jgi:hypothetical protein
MTTYPIHPAERLQARILRVLEADLLDLDAFTGCSFVNERDADETSLPMVVARISESENAPLGSNLWNVTVTLQMMEDRKESEMTLAGDDRGRHEIRKENLSARIFGEWNGLTLAAAINAISDGRGVYVLKVHNNNYAPMSDIDLVVTEYSVTFLCTSTQQ